VGFFGQLAAGGLGAQEGLWRGDRSSNVPFALTGQSGILGPGLGSGVVYSSFFEPPSLNNQGVAAFGGFLSGNGIDDRNENGHWKNGGSQNQPFAQSGVTNNLGPGLGPTISHQYFGGNYLINDNADVFYLSSLAGASINNSNNVAFWRNSGGTNEPVARTGDDGALGPGLGGGTVFTASFLVATDFRTNDAIAFGGIANGPATSGQNQLGLWRHAGGVNSPFALAGQAGALGPGLAGPDVFSLFDGLGINESGKTAYYATLNNQARGVWKNSEGVNSPLALTGRTDDLGPGLGAGISFADFPRLISPTPTQITENGQVLFQGILSPGNRRGLWLNGGDHNIPIAVAGETGGLGPGLGPSMKFIEFDSRTVMNSSGLVAFQAELTHPGPVFPSDNHGVWAYVNGGLELIARSGQQMDVDWGAGIDLRTVSFVDIHSGTSHSGIDSLNDSGELAFRVGFTDGSQGVFVAHLVPEPKSNCLLMCMTGALALGLRMKPRAI
jgi:hypothetical protein